MAWIPNGSLGTVPVINAAPMSYVSNGVVPVRKNVRRDSAIGLVGDSSGTYNDGYWQPQRTAGAKALSVLWLADMQSGSFQNCKIWGCGADATTIRTNSPFHITGSTLYFGDTSLNWSFNETGNYKYARGAVNHGMSAAGYFCGAMIWRGNNIVEFYRNGVAVAVTNTESLNNGAGIASVGYDGTLMTQYSVNSPLAVSAVFAGAWSPGTASYLTTRPWSAFQSNGRRLYFGAGAGGGVTADISGTQATDVGAITAEATTGAAIAGTQATDVGAVAVEATTGAAIAGTQASDGAAVNVTASTGTGTDAEIAGTQASDIGAATVLATVGAAIAGTQDSDVGYITVSATIGAAIAASQSTNRAAITVSGASVWADVSPSTTVWSDVSAASTVWSDL